MESKLHSSSGRAFSSIVIFAYLSAGPHSFGTPGCGEALGRVVSRRHFLKVFAATSVAAVVRPTKLLPAPIAPSVPPHVGPDITYILSGQFYGGFRGLPGHTLDFGLIRYRPSGFGFSPPASVETDLGLTQRPTPRLKLEDLSPSENEPAKVEEPMEDLQSRVEVAPTSFEETLTRAEGQYTNEVTPEP